jgi:hypothetical protein
MMRNLLVSLLVLAVLPAAAAAAPPVNDDYWKSLSFNAPGTRLPRGNPEKVGAKTDTSEATVQSDLFAPEHGTGGGAENLTCQNRMFGKTVWYDLHPDVTGLLHLQVAGFPTVMAAYTYDLRSGKITGEVDCKAGDSISNELFLPVSKGRHYTIQVGGIDSGSGPLGGPMESTEAFFPDRDGDGVLDVVDKCPTVKGVQAQGGCPPRLNPNVFLNATPTASGIVLTGLKVTAAARGAAVRVSCTPSCGFGARSHRAGASRSVSFPELVGRAIRAGSRLDVSVTQRGTIGKLARYEIRRGNFTRVDRCIQPSGRVTKC